MLYFVLGVVVGLIIGLIIRHVQTGNGILKIDHFNPEKDVYRFEIDNLDDLSEKKYIKLKIDHDADLSQE